ncbi:hypothetical protein HHK36_025345 [Tetracentron sinense]|uniref:Pectinesterase n=1 Tax=Tetracentron sinense TaxID=13715 RepID=A0A834YL73_TETSI|nr:hypothetical protein HHK36_025345 [Tetracentron sinense]
MAFQDFSHLTERRRAEKQQKLRKRIAIATISFIVLLVLIASGIFGVVYESGHATKTPEIQPTKELSHTQKAVKMICAHTDYKKTCETSLLKVMNSNSSSSQPKDLLKAAISIIVDEVDKALNHSSMFKFDKPDEKAAFEDCKVLLKDAKEELEESISHVGGHNLGKLPTRTHDLNSWLSAVMSYQQTCIDGFPEGKLKSGMEKTMKSAKELTSNALAIVSEVSSILSMLQIPGLGHRHLLTKESSRPTLDRDGLPNWMTHADRRMLKANGAKLNPNVIVAKDGSGNYTTITDALAAMPLKYKGRYVIYIKVGIYDETVTVTKKMVNLTMYGDGSRKTIVTGRKNFVDGVRTFQTATFVALGEGFMAKAMGFRNTAGPEKHQAVAIRVQSDHSVFLNCRMEGYQDTLYAQTHRQFYRSCVIAGTVDFIFGDAAAIFQNCMIVIRKPLDNQRNIVTAQGRIDRHETTGIVIQNCRILPDKKLIPLRFKLESYLGRPWKEYSRTIIMESTIGDLIHADGWLPWEGDFALKTLSYGEYNNRGPGAKLTARIKWPGYKVIKKQEAMKYTVGAFLQGDWMKTSGTPVHLGLFH